MNIIIKILEDGKVIDFENLSEEKKKEYGQRINDQALTALGYEAVKN